MIFTGTQITYWLGGVRKVLKQLTSLLLVDLRQSPGFGVHGCFDVGVYIYAATVASSHYFVFCPLKDSLLDARGEIQEARPGSTTTTGPVTSLLA
jgi:hypothetical protein